MIMLLGHWASTLQNYTQCNSPYITIIAHGITSTELACQIQMTVVLLGPHPLSCYELVYPTIV